MRVLVTAASTPERVTRECFFPFNPTAAGGTNGREDSARRLIRESQPRVPPERPELYAFLNQGVEKRQAHEEFFKRKRPCAAVEEIRIGNRVARKTLHHVRAHALRGLVGHLDAVLKHRDLR